MDEELALWLEARLPSLRIDGSEDVIVAFGSHGSSTDCPGGHLSVTVGRGMDTATGNALGLKDAMSIARWKLGQMHEAREKAAAKKKADAA